MTIFELVKIALDQLYAEGTDLHGRKLDERIIHKLGYLSKSYKELTKPSREPVDYKDPATRFAYVYKYVAAHGDYLVQVLRKLAAKNGRAIFETNSVRVSCLGGGPGSEIIAVLKYLDEQQDDEPVEKLTCYLLDKEQAWSDIWTELNEHFRRKVDLNTPFQTLDIANTESWKHQRKFLQADLFTMVYFVSEVLTSDKDGDVSESWQHIFRNAKPGALFVYVDNGHEDFTSYFDKLWKAVKLKCILAGDNEKWTPRSSEEKSELGKYRKKFGQDPKIQALLTYRVLRKT